MAVRVMVVENHPMIRHHLRERLRAARDLEVVGEATGSPALALIGLIEPEVIILDMHTSPAAAVGMINEIRIRFPAVRVVAFGESDDEGLRHEAVQAGAWGYVPAMWNAEDLAHFVRSVARGSRRGVVDLTSAAQRASPR